MAQLEDITRGAAVNGILPEGLVTVLDVKWVGTVAIEVTYKDTQGRLGSELLYRGENHDPNLIAVASDEPLDLDVPVFDLNDACAICDLIEAHFLS